MSRAASFLIPALALALAACGGGSGATTWASPAEAAEAGAQSLATGELETAAAAFAQAAEAADPAAKVEALTGLFTAQLRAGAAAEAIAAARRLAAEGGASVSEQVLKGLADSAILERNAEVADAVIGLALERFPGAKDTFAKAVQAVDALKTQGAGADLSSLGYTGD